MGIAEGGGVMEPGWPLGVGGRLVIDGQAVFVSSVDGAEVRAFTVAGQLMRFVLTPVAVEEPGAAATARTLNERRLATLLLDLLTIEEELDRAKVFDIGLLAERLVAATRWTRTEPQVAELRVGYFGASTGAGAALWAAASRVRSVATRAERAQVARIV